MKNFFSSTKIAVIVISFFFVPSVHGQYYTPSIVLADPEYQNIHYSGVVRTKEYVAACLPWGKRITVPVINGIAPKINPSYFGNSAVYDLDYDSGKIWNGKSPINYANIKKQPVTEIVEVVRTPTKDVYAQKLKDQQDTIDDLKASVAELQKMIKIDKPKVEELPTPSPGLKKPLEKIQPEKPKIEELSTPPGMKKPSEIKGFE